ncbi:MAG: leucine-rich repeat protein, partial [Candidatus Ventricola sp.]
NTMDNPICGKLTSVTLPESVTALDSYAFSATYALKTLTLSSGISAWGDDLFGQYRNEYPILYCAADSTTARTMTASACPQGYTDPADPDWSWAAGGGKTLVKYHGSDSDVVVPAGAQKLGDAVFSSMDALTSVTLPDSVTAIGRGAFEASYNLEAIYLSDNISEWGELPFGYTNRAPALYCTKGSTTALNLSASFSYTDPADPYWSWVGGSSTVVAGYHGSATRLRLPDGITGIGDQAFYDNRTLTSITVPASVTSIGNEAFGVYDYYANRSAYPRLHVYLPDGITSAGSHLSQVERTIFHVSLGSLTASAISEGAQDGDYCYAIDDAMPEWRWALTQDGPCFAGYTGQDTVINVPAVAKGIFRPNTDDPEVLKACHFIADIRLPEGLTTIRERAYEGYSWLTSLSLPSTLTTICPYAFTGCTRVTHLEIPDGVTALPESMCQFCFNLAYVTIPDSVTSIADNAFDDCPLKTVYCNPGSYAETWAKSKKLNVAPPTGASYALVIPDPNDIKPVTGVPFDWRSYTAVVPTPDIPYKLTVTSSDIKIAVVEGDYLRFLKPAQYVELTFSCPELGLTQSAKKYNAQDPVQSFSLEKAYYVKQGSTLTITPLNTVPSKNVYLIYLWVCTKGGEQTLVWENSSLEVNVPNFTMLDAGVHDLTAVAYSGVTRSAKVVVYNTIGAPAFAPFNGEYCPGMVVYPHITVTFDDTAYEDEPAFYTLTSSNSSIAMPTEDGGVQLLAPGTATITAALPGGATLRQTITVDDESLFVLPASLTRLEDQALAGSQASIVLLPDGCLSIGAGAFAGCTELHRIEIPATVESIADDAFDGCNLEGLTIVTSAGSYAERWAKAHGIDTQNE